MAALRRGTLFLPPMQQVRCGSKINFKRPKPRHDARRLFEEITKPVYLPESLSPLELCAKKLAEIRSQTQEENPFEAFLLRQCKKMLNENRMIGVCQALPMSAETRKAARNTLLDLGMNLQFFSGSLMKKAIADTELVNMGPWLLGKNVYVISKQPMVEEMVKALRKIHELVLLGGKVDNYLLSREGLTQLSKMPPLDHLRGELVTVLGSPSSRTWSLLGRHQQTLAANLDQYIKQTQQGQS